MPNTEEQQAAIEAAASNDSIALEALAGTGKTFTLVQMAGQKKAQTLAMAFNKRNSDDLAKRMPPHVIAKTMNGIGHGALNRWLAQSLTLDNSKVEKLISNLCKEERIESSDTWTAIRKLVHAAKATGIVPSTWTARPARSFVPDDDGTWLDLSDRYDIEATPLDIRYARTVLGQSNDLALTGVIDFSDQIYLSTTLLGAPFQRFERLIVDEAQDLSPLQHFMVKKSSALKSTGLTAGDRFQAIYAWRGASEDSIDLLNDQFAAKRLPLTLCFRCSQAVIEEAQKLVPDIRCPPGTRAGSVSSLPAWESSSIRPGSAILCRNNAPLISMAFRLIRERRGIQMLGRDFGAGLKKLIRDLKATDISSLLGKLEDWRMSQYSLAMAKFNYQKAESVNDKAMSISVLAEEARDIEDLLNILETLFSKVSKDITLSTGHRSKGLEWPDVFFLDQHLVPGKWDTAPGTPPWVFRQALNLRYVVTTRAQDNLYYVNGEDWNK